jgi:hypothetical protein
MSGKFLILRVTAIGLLLYFVIAIGLILNIASGFSGKPFIADNALLWEVCKAWGILAPVSLGVALYTGRPLSALAIFILGAGVIIGFALAVFLGIDIDGMQPESELRMLSTGAWMICCTPGIALCAWQIVLLLCERIPTPQREILGCGVSHLATTNSTETTSTDRPQAF